MTRVFHKGLYPETSAECALCLGAEEDCARLFLGYPFAREIWNQQTISRVNTTSETSFWESFRRSGGRSRVEGVRILVGLWAIELHQNDKLFDGRPASTHGVAYTVDGFVAA